MIYSFYPGCALDGSALHYRRSCESACRALALDLRELEDWNCCGATAYMSVRELRSFAISARNLALAEASGPGTQLVAVCNGCYVVLKKTNLYFREDEHLRSRISGALAAGGLEYHGRVKVRHLLDVLVNDVGCQEIQERVTRPLEGLRVAPYYGCQIGRPEPSFDHPEHPQSFDALLAALGAEVVPYPLKAECCGGMLMTTSEGVCQGLVRRLLECAIRNGAQCIATLCPLCNVNLEAYQGKLNRRFGTDFRMPVLPFTQLVGLALGVEPGKLGLGMELVAGEKVLPIGV